MSTTQEIASYARFLRNAAPQEYDNFCAAFGNYARFTVETMVKATGDLVLAQGHAQQCLNILRILEDARNG